MWISHLDLLPYTDKADAIETMRKLRYYSVQGMRLKQYRIPRVFKGKECVIIRDLLTVDLDKAIARCEELLANDNRSHVVKSVSRRLELLRKVKWKSWK